MYMYIYNVYVLWSGSRARVAKKGGKRETPQSRPPPPWGFLQSRDCGAHHFRGSEGLGCPGFAWTLGATARRAEPQPPALPSLKQERRQLSSV